MKKKYVRCGNYSDIVETISQGKYHKGWSQLFEVERKTITVIMGGKITDRELLENMMGDW